jgi:hypothetical protein
MSRDRDKGGQTGTVGGVLNRKLEGTASGTITEYKGGQAETVRCVSGAGIMIKGDKKELLGVYQE